MSGFAFAWRKGTAFPTPLAIEVLVGKSTQIHAGDVLVLSVNSTYTGTTTSQYPVARPLLSGDTISTSNGILGVALFDIQTNSSGNLITVTSPVTVDTRGKLDTSLPYTNDLPVDPVSGYIRIFCAAFDPQNVFWGLTDANEIANFYDLNRSAGITASSATFPANYTVDPDAGSANAPLVIEYVDSEFPQFNSANGGGRLGVSCKPTFYARNLNPGWFT